jgi:hypothetical protein
MKRRWTTSRTLERVSDKEKELKKPLVEFGVYRRHLFCITNSASTVSLTGLMHTAVYIYLYNDKPIIHHPPLFS